MAQWTGMGSHQYASVEHGQGNKEHGLNNDPSTGQIKIEAWRMAE